MNTKTTKFLAVLAVLVMAFAAVAIIAPADDSDAATAEYTSPGASSADTYVITGSDIELDSGKSVVEAKDSVTIVKAASGATLYLLPGSTATIKTETAMKIQTVTATEKKLADAGIAIAISAADTLTLAVDSNGALTVSGTSATVTSLINDEGKITISGGEITSDGTVTNNGTVFLGSADVSAITSITGKVIINGTTITGYQGSSIVAGKSASFAAATSSSTEAVFTATYTTSKATIVIESSTVTASVDRQGDKSDSFAWDLTVNVGATLNLGNMKVNQKSSITNNGTINVMTDAIVDVIGTFTNNGTIANSGLITVDVLEVYDKEKKETTTYTGELDGTGSISGSGTLSVLGELTTGTIAGGYPAVTCYVSLFEGSTWTNFTDGTALTITGEGDDLALTLKINTSTSGTTTTVTGISYNIYSDITINGSGTLDKGVPDTVVVESGKVTFSNALIIESGDSIKFAADASYAVGKDVVITNNGTIDFAVASQYVKGSIANDNFRVAGKAITTTTATEVKTTDFATTDTVVATAAVVTATIPEGKTLIIEDTTALVSVDVTATGSEVVVQSDAKRDFSMVVGTQTVKFSEIVGKVALSKGSIVIMGDPWTSGTIELNNGDELKISGTIDGDVEVKLATGATSASITIVKDTTLTIAAGASLTINSGITTNIYGTLAVIDDDVDPGVATTKAVNIYGTLIGKLTNRTGTEPDYTYYNVTVYAGADISAGDWYAVNNEYKGSDGNGGTWTYNKETSRLTLDNYNGPAYFSWMNIEELVLKGDNVITVTDFDAEDDYIFMSYYDLTEGYSGAMEVKSLSGHGTLTINVDIALTYEDAFCAFWVEDGQLTITGVDVTINITSQDIAAAGIYAKDLKIFNAEVDITVSTGSYVSYEKTNTRAIEVLEDAEIEASTLNLKAGMDGLVVGTSKLVFGNLTVKASDITATASVSPLWVDGVLDVSQASNITLEALNLTAGEEAYALEVNYLHNYSYSTITANSILLVLGGTNYADIINNGNMVIASAGEYVSEVGGTLINNGLIGVYGGIVMNAGEIVNNGTITTYKTATPQNVDQAITTGTATYVSNITISNDKIDYQTADGTLFIGEANITLKGIADVNKYYGTATYDKNGVLTGANLRYVSYDDFGMQYISTVNISAAQSSDSTAAATKYMYSIVSYGSYIDTYDEVKTTVGSTTLGTATAGVAITILGGFDTTSYITVAGGTFDNDGTVLLNSSSQNLVAGGTFENGGTLNAVDSITISSGTLDNAGTFAASANVTVSGGKLVGDFTVADGSVITIAEGDIDSTVTYAGTYKYTAPGSTSSTDVAFSNVMDILGKGASTGVVITAATNLNAASTLNISGMTNVDSKTGMKLTLNEGKSILSGDIATGGDIYVLTGATLQAGTAVNDEGVIAIQDGATFNRWIDNDTTTYSYGKVTYVIEFANEGYTYYGNLAFALENAPEDASMTLSSSTSITTDTAVKDGVVLTLANGVTLDVKGEAGDDGSITLTMGDGAKFVMPAGTTITFQYVTASADIVYEDNEIILDEAVFDAATASTLYANALPERFNLTFEDIDSGVVELAAGDSAGTIGVSAVKDATTEDTYTSYGTIKIDSDASSSIVITPGVNPSKAVITIDGELDIAAGSANVDLLKAPITGDGEIVLGDGASIKSVKSVAQNIAIGNGFDYIDLSSVKDGGDGAAYTISSVAKTSTVDAYVLITGTISTGSATVNGNVYATQLILSKAAASLVVPEGSKLTVVNDVIAGKEYNLDATGLLMVAGTINMYTTSSTSYGKVHYDITYPDGGYTVYTIMATAITKAPAGTTLSVNDNLTINAETGPAIIDANKSIVIAEGKYIKLENTYMVIGEGFDTIGASAIISGNIVLDGAWVIDFVGSGSDISVYTDTAMTKAAKETDILVQDTEYAVVYTTTKDIVFKTAMLLDEDDNNVTIADLVEPTIKGYYFKSWTLLNGNAVGNATTLASAPFVATLVASQVAVTFVAVDGVDYYVDGVMQNILDAPVKVAYGATVTAKINDKSTYTGTPLINGKAYVIIDDSTTSLKVTGVAPIPEPTPEPVEKESEWTLTNILLVILVVLIAVMAIIVALRLSRS